MTTSSDPQPQQQDAPERPLLSAIFPESNQTVPVVGDYYVVTSVTPDVLDFHEGSCTGIQLTRAADLPRATAEAEWQPIETAPRDGTRVLFYTPESEEIGWLAFVCESFYDKHGELNDVHVAQWQDGMGPTHWQPLPSPPLVQVPRSHE